MLNFLKKLFAKEEIREEKIKLNELNSWLDQKAKPILEDLNDNINQIINKINNEKEKVNENLKTLENAQLQNPKIPERVKTIMQGNRAAFIKKVSFFFNNLNFDYNNYNELIEKCNTINNDIESLGKSTARSYQVLNEFFAREAENVAINIKNIENYSKDIKNSIKDSKISIIEKIKDDIINIQHKIELKQNLTNNLKNEKNNYEDKKNKKLEIENKINEIKSSADYKNYEKLLEEKEKITAELNNIENRIFHDFSVLEKAFKKYAKIAFENEKLILEYLSSPIKTLITDNDSKIIKILNNLKNAIKRNELGLDTKKSEKTLSKIEELNDSYFTNLQKNYNNFKNKINELELSIENNKSNIELKLNNKELEIAKLNVEKLDNDILNINNELEKINIKKLKENLQEEINNAVNARVTVL